MRYTIHVDNTSWESGIDKLRIRKDQVSSILGMIILLSSNKRELDKTKQVDLPSLQWPESLIYGRPSFGSTPI